MRILRTIWSVSLQKISNGSMYVNILDQPQIQKVQVCCLMPQKTELREAQIHFELHRHLQNAIDNGISLHGITFARSEAEYTQNLAHHQRADLVLFDDRDRAWVVIEAKRK